MEILKDYFLSKDQLLYILAFSFFTLGEVWGLDSSTLFYRGLAILSALLIVIKIYLQKSSLKEYFRMLLLMTLMIICYLNSGAITLVLSMLFIIASKGIDIERLFLTNIIIRIISFISIIILSLFNLRPNVIIHMLRMTGDEAIRYSLGFNHPNELHMQFFTIVVMFLAIFYKKLKWNHYLYISILNIIVYKYSVSRTGMIAIFSAIIITLILKLFEKKEINIPSIVALLVPLCSIFSVVSTILYTDSGILNVLNRLLQGRISNSQYFWKLSGATFFGQELNYTTSDLILDNSYVILWLNCGILVFILFNVAYYLTLLQLIKNKDYSGILIIILFAIYGITEGFLSNIFLNPSLVYITCLYNNNILEKIKNIFTQNIYMKYKRGI